MSTPLVVIKDLNRVFRRVSTEVVALDNINLEIRENAFLVLTGPSGSGKTTLLNILAGIDKPTSGSVRVGTENIHLLNEDQLASWRNRHVGYVYQTFNLIPVLTANENVELPLLLTHLSRQERREHVETAMRLVGLSDRADHYPGQLSGGQEQRVGIARAIVTDPTIILADEPTGDLDARSAEDILSLLATLHKDFNKTIIMVTHDLRAAHHAKEERHLEKGLMLPPGGKYTVEEAT